MKVTPYDPFNKQLGSNYSYIAIAKYSAKEFCRNVLHTFLNTNMHHSENTVSNDNVTHYFLDSLTQNNVDSLTWL